MERIEPTVFRGPRAYFTSIDHRITSRSQDKQLLRKKVERELKVLLLVKGVVVCAASHLTSGFAYSLFRDNPHLLNQGLVIPALRRDRRDMADVFEGSDVPALSDDLGKEMIQFYNDNLREVVTWDLVDNSAWFRNQFLHHLKDQNSVLRKHLKKTSQKQIAQMVDKVEADPLLERGTVEELSETLKGTDRTALLNFRELLYHISGSRVVHCEGTLPREYHVDYDLSDIAGGNTSLSDVRVFWKVFLELAFDTLRKPNLPVELLDLLTFDDISQIREPLLSGDFQKKYDEIVEEAARAIISDNPGEAVLDVDHIMQIRNELAPVLAEVFDKELADFSRKKMKSVGGQAGLASSGTSLALTILSNVPVPIVSGIAGTVGMIKEMRSLVINLSSTIRSRKGKNQYEAYVGRRNALLRELIKKSRVSEKTPLLDVVDVLASYLGEKIRT